jgi:hypothetical protein
MAKPWGPPALLGHLGCWGWALPQGRCGWCMVVHACVSTNISVTCNLTLVEAGGPGALPLVPLSPASRGIILPCPAIMQARRVPE